MAAATRARPPTPPTTPPTIAPVGVLDPPLEGWAVGEGVAVVDVAAPAPAEAEADEGFTDVFNIRLVELPIREVIVELPLVVVLSSRVNDVVEKLRPLSPIYVVNIGCQLETDVTSQK